MQSHAEPFRNYIKKSIFEHLFFQVTIFSPKPSLFTSRQRFFLSKSRVLQVSGRDTLENAYKITSKSKFSTQNVQIPYYLHPALSYSLLYVHPWDLVCPLLGYIQHTFLCLSLSHGVLLAHGVASVCLTWREEYDRSLNLFLLIFLDFWGNFD